jgi:flagellar basal-body rod protein FlgB
MDREFRILEKITQAADMRQKVIASNIANADTPGYKATDLVFKNILGNEQVKLLTSDPKHIAGSKLNTVNGKLIVEDNPSWGDGNNVELDVEVAKMTENSLLFNAAVTIMTAKLRMFKNAIRGG